MSNRILLLSVICAFLISMSPINASDVNYSINNTNHDQIDNINNFHENKSLQKDLNNLATTGNNSLVSNNLATAGNNSSAIKNLAAGEDKPSKLSQTSIIEASFFVISYVSKNGKLPDSVEISGYRFSMPEYLYLASKTIQLQSNKNNSLIKVKYNVKDPKKPVGTNIKMEISSNTFHNFASRVASFITKHSTAPNFLNSGSSKIQYQTLIYFFAEALAWSKYYGNSLPNSLSFNVKKTSQLNKYMPKNTIVSKSKTVSSKKINIDYEGEPLEEYLTSSNNCPVDDKAIKSLANQITKKYNSTLDKAKAIFNWVKNNIAYSFYYNTKFGPIKTIDKKIGNCVDQTHLIVALSRASGIASRYVHGKCNFISGNTYGHVWAQVKVGNTWYAADSTSSKNSFGVINNWNTNSYVLNGIYTSLSF